MAAAAAATAAAARRARTSCAALFSPHVIPGLKNKIKLGSAQPFAVSSKKKVDCWRVQEEEAEEEDEEEELKGRRLGSRWAGPRRRNKQTEGGLKFGLR